ncbi:MAG: FAD-binding oxidoreductase [Deltaproteobacteria bacterium]|nr:FAD-binding oxidoreductase [Deltaproteobacteria bacterium]
MVIIVGGGLTGIGVALGLLEKGLSDFVIIEQNDSILNNNSANSFSLIHSGIRFLQHARIKSFFESQQASKEVAIKFSSSVRSIQSAVYLNDLNRFHRTLAKLATSLNIFQLKTKDFFGKEGLYLIWNDYYIFDFCEFRNQLLSLIKGKIKFTISVNKVNLSNLDTNLGKIEFDKLVLACFPSHLSEFRVLWAWNVLTDINYDLNTCVGYKLGNRFIFCLQRTDGLSFGTWYSNEKPSEQMIKRSIEDIRNAFSINLTKFRIELGVIPSSDGVNPVTKTYVLTQNEKVWKIYPSKLTTFLHTGRKVAKQLLSL